MTPTDAGSTAPNVVLGSKMPAMPYAVGIVLAVLICAFARAVGFDRDRAFYPTVLVVTASYYGLFAVIGGSMRALALESLVMTAFVIAAVAGFKGNLWLVAAGFGAHAVFDVVHGDLVDNPGVPAWWPAFCMTIDVAIAACLAWLWSGSGACTAACRPDAHPPPRRHERRRLTAPFRAGCRCASAARCWPAASLPGPRWRSPCRRRR